jgi:hypothetical protein
MGRGGITMAWYLDGNPMTARATFFRNTGCSRSLCITDRRLPTTLAGRGTYTYTNTDQSQCDFTRVSYLMRPHNIICPKKRISSCRKYTRYIERIHIIWDEWGRTAQENSKNRMEPAARTASELSAAQWRRSRGIPLSFKPFLNCEK